MAENDLFDAVDIVVNQPNRCNRLTALLAQESGDDEMDPFDDDEDDGDYVQEFDGDASDIETDFELEVQ